MTAMTHDDVKQLVRNYFRDNCPSDKLETAIEDWKAARDEIDDELIASRDEGELAISGLSLACAGDAINVLLWLLGESDGAT
jgi:hypothetical protein